MNLDTKYSISRETRVINILGMHARPAAKIAEMTMNAKGGIWLSDGVSTVDASSIIDLLTLCAARGTQIFIQAENIEDSEIADQIKQFFDKGFGEKINE